MKIIKKYAYKLTKESLDEDIAQFAKEASKGAYTWDYKNNMEGLRIIKQYFKLIQKEFDQGNFGLCKDCYKRLLFLILQEGYEHSYFGYEDIVSRSKLDFEKIISQYFICLIKLHNVRDLFNEFIEYLEAKQDYHFKSAEQAIMEELSEDDFAKFKELLKSKNIGKEDYAMHDILYFLLDLENDEKEVMRLAKKFAPILGYDDLNHFLKDYREVG